MQTDNQHDMLQASPDGAGQTAVMRHYRGYVLRCAPGVVAAAPSEQIVLPWLGAGH